MKIKKRILSCFLSLCMIFTISAGLGATKASALNWYVSTLFLYDDNDFLSFAKMVNDGRSFEGETVILRNDITLGSDFPIIGKYGFFSNKFFSGTFDGQGHTITGNITSKNNFVGLFGCIKNATLKDFTYIGDVTGDNDTAYQDNATAGICAYLNGSNRIENVTHSGSVEGYSKSGAGVGGITGFSDINSDDLSVINCTQTGDNSTISLLNKYDNQNSCGIVGGRAKEVINCTNYSNISSNHTTYGICYIADNVEGCTNNGNVTSTNWYAAGICSSNNVSNCTNNGTVTGKYYVAGISLIFDDAVIKDCVNTGTIIENSTGNSLANAGGIITDDGSQTKGTCLIDRCVNTGNVTGTYYAGGVYGRISTFKYETTISNCINSGTIQTKDISGLTSYASAIMSGYSNNAITVTSCYNIGNVSNVGHRYFVDISNEKHKNNVKVSNCYNLGVIVDQDGVVDKSIEQFKSGEVCWLLNGGNNNNPPVFYQTIAKDNFPALDSEGVVCYEDSTYKNEDAHYVFSSPENGESLITAYSGTTITTAQAVSKGAPVTIEAKPNQGYKIKEWQQPKSEGKTTASVVLTESPDKSKVTFTMPDADVNIVPIFDYDYYNVTFKILDSAWEVSSQDVLHNNELTVPDVEAKMKEYGIDVTFKNWVYNNKTISEDGIKTADDFRKDTVIYADITTDGITVDFYDENGSSLTGDIYKAQVANLTSDINIPNPPYRYGYKTGWRINGTDGEFLTMSNLNTLKGQVKLYADYSNEFTVTFAIKGSDFEPELEKDFVIESQIVNSNEEVKFPTYNEIANSLEEEFNIKANIESWSTKDIEFSFNTGSQFDEQEFREDAYNLTKDAVIYANIKFNKIEVDFWDESSQELYPTQTVLTPDQIVLPEVPDKYKGYKKGWTNGSKGDYVTDENKENILVSTFGEDVTYTLYAKYEKPEITKANEFEYTPDETKAYADAKGFTANISPTDGQSISKINWWLSKDNGTDYTYLLTQNETTISGEGECLVGLIVYDIPKSITNLTAGVSVE